MSDSPSMPSRRDALLAVLCIGAAPWISRAQAPEWRTAMAASPYSLPAAANDFDFFVGDWNVRHRRLRRRLAGDDHWVEFGGRTQMRKTLGGLGNVDENVLDLPGGRYEAVTLRLYRPDEARWSIWWIDGRDPHLEPPVHGSFENGVGTFFGDDTFEGKPIRVRFVWSHITPRSARWEQAFSPDQGRSWETNWRMDFERRA